MTDKAPPFEAYMKHGRQTSDELQRKALAQEMDTVAGRSGVFESLMTATKDIKPDGSLERSSVIAQRIHKVLEPLRAKERKRVIELAGKRLSLDDAARAKDKAYLEWSRDQCADVQAWIAKTSLPEPIGGGGFRIERPTAPAYHHLMQAITEGKLIDVSKRTIDGQRAARLEYLTALASAEIFVIEHDWAAAFAGATDYDNASFRLPFDSTVFEFRISGRRLMILGGNYSDPGAENEIVVAGIVESAGGWVIGAPIYVRGGELYMNGENEPADSGLTKVCVAQIKAACIALEAEAATYGVIRADAKFAKARVKAGKVPPRDYHVVSLSRRSRAAPRLDAPAETGRHVRLHFRRGHWRHFETHRTWIKWMLVGDPDLGFVDKHYRL